MWKRNLSLSDLFLSIYSNLNEAASYGFSKY